MNGLFAIFKDSYTYLRNPGENLEFIILLHEFIDLPHRNSFGY